MSLGRLVIFGGVSYTQLISKLLTDLISICATYQRLFIEHRIHVLLSYSRHIANVIVISASHTQQATNKRLYKVQAYNYNTRVNFQCI